MTEFVLSWGNFGRHFGFANRNLFKYVKQPFLHNFPTTKSADSALKTAKKTGQKSAENSKREFTGDSGKNGRFRSW
ncbi:hypothetical protein HYV83_01800 [Candidatus Woesearchaeota archaeon]|nr:hypothetical protein [Candidatus Woesearchaeota archaeon]